MDKVSDAQWSTAEAGVLRLVYSGRLTADDVRRADEEMLKLFDRHPDTRAVVVHTGEVVGFSPSVADPSKAMMLHMKEKGIRHMPVISPSAAIRMFGAAMALFSAVRIKFFENESDALKYLRGELAKKAS